MARGERRPCRCLAGVGSHAPFDPPCGRAGVADRPYRSAVRASAQRSGGVLVGTGEKMALAVAALYVGWAAYRAAFRNIPFLDGLKYPGATDWRPPTVLSLRSPLQISQSSKADFALGRRGF